MARQDGDATTGLDENVGDGPDEREDARATAIERKQAKSRGESMNVYEGREDLANRLGGRQYQRNTGRGR